jgi:hypothetical protein
VAIAGDPRTKRLRGKARPFKQAVDKNFGIDFGIDANSSAHEGAPLEHALSAAADDIQLTVADPCVSDYQFHCPLSQPCGPLSGICRERILAAS